ncbi:hypothetical protein LIA77_06962 [Sarocladium implicatum]|nr:hypothetical protein LIA77_06962 [Sarocladium implicatum]
MATLHIRLGLHLGALLDRCCRRGRPTYWALQYSVQIFQTRGCSLVGYVSCLCRKLGRQMTCRRCWEVDEVQRRPSGGQPDRNVETKGLGFGDFEVQKAKNAGEIRETSCEAVRARSKGAEEVVRKVHGHACPLCPLTVVRSGAIDTSIDALSDDHIPNIAGRATLEGRYSTPAQSKDVWPRCIHKQIRTINYPSSQDYSRIHVSVPLNAALADMS